MLNVSPYADAESGAPSWKPGEREAAIVFLSLALYIILDVNVSIYRVFRRKRGLYYWSLICATWGTAVVVVGNILKNFKPKWEDTIWILWTILINLGWSIYAPAELLVLYSRLHLVNQNDRLHRYLLIMIIVGSTLVIIPNWVCIFPAYDPDPGPSSEWSPRMAIVDRYSQACFTVFEVIISSVYIHSLREILRTKINTRTRRVMRDLILVNVIVISMDLIVIILIFLDQANLAYPLQDLAYAFKYKIEFAVLNQLMAVAASGSRHGSRQTTWEEKRYRRPGHATILKGYSDDDLTGVRLPFLSMTTGETGSPQSTLVSNEQNVMSIDTADHASTAKPPSVIMKDRVGIESHIPNFSTLERPERNVDDDFDFQPGPDLALSNYSSSVHSPSLGGRASEEKHKNEIPLAPIADDGKNLTLAVTQEPSLPSPRQRKKNRLSLRQLILRQPAATNFEMLTSENSPQIPSERDKAERSRIAPFNSSTFGGNGDLQEDSLASNTEKKSGQPPGNSNHARNDDGHKDEDQEEEDNFHAWERHRAGKPALEVPWFRKQTKDGLERSEDQT